LSDTPDLQSQSDQNRIEFLRTELSACFTFASVAETEFNIGNNEHAQRSIADAEKAYATMQRFLSDPKHAEHISGEGTPGVNAGDGRTTEEIGRSSFAPVNGCRRPRQAFVYDHHAHHVFLKFQ